MDKNISLGHIDLHYKVFSPPQGGSSRHFVILPGWGGCSDSWAAVSVQLQKIGYTVFVLDWPGFGKTPEMSRAWVTDDFALLVAEFLRKLKIKNPIILGHSHGGRVLIKLLAQNKIKFQKIFLFAAAGLPHPLNWKQKIARFISFFGKFFLHLPLLGRPIRYFRQLIYRAVGAHDYLALKSRVMKKTMASVLSEDLSHLLPEIPVKIILLWGDHDTYTPLADGRKMHRLLPDSKLTIIPGARHGLHLRDPEKFFTILKEHL